MARTANTRASRPIITIFGSSRTPPMHPLYQAALELGRRIAEANWIVCNGGYGGTMEAAARGAHEAGGHTIGVTCRAFNRGGGPNAYIRQEVPTFDPLTRLNTLVRLGRAYVVLPGGTGTLLELAAVWEMLNKKILRIARPLILLGTFWEPVVKCLCADETEETLRPQIAPDVAAVWRLLQQSELSDESAAVS